ncbi:MAG: YdcH family protein [Thermodesulfobacterium sp.]|nr:YdcH family protein [Thermodesulfobacterium sp.]
MNKEVVKRFGEKYPDVKELFEKHQSLENEVAQIFQKNYLTPEEEIKVKHLKREKLYIKEQIYRLIKQYEGIEID